MICLDSTASVTLRNKLGDILLHVGPLVPLAQIMVHLVAARMDRQL